MVAALSYILFFVMVPYRFVTYLMYEKTRVRGGELGDRRRIIPVPCLGRSPGKKYASL